MSYLVYDIGGTSIKYAVIEEDLEIKVEGKIPRQETFEQMIEEMVKTYEEQSEIKGISISAPGTVDTETGIIGGASALNYIHGPNFKEIFKERTGFEIAIENDANCAALSEAYFGIGKNFNNIIYIVIGSGIGGAILKDQKIQYGVNKYGGEFGYQIVNSKGETWSEVGSTVNLVNRVRKLKNNFFIEGKEVFELAKTDEKVAELVAEFYDCNAMSIFNLQIGIDPDIILIGGAVCENEEVIKQIKMRVDENRKRIKIPHDFNIEVGKFGRHANLYGALANLLLQEKQNN